MKKGVSAVIATLLMLIITIGLAGLAYTYMSGIITGTAAKTIRLSGAVCDADTNTVTVIIKNLDTTNSIAAGEVSVFIDGTTISGTVPSIPAGGQVTHSGTSTAATSGTHTVRILGPANDDVKTGVICEWKLNNFPVPN